MNVRSTREFFEANNVVAMRAYKSPMNPDVDNQMIKLGNKLTAIPFYAIYAPGEEEPVTFDGIISAGGIQDEIKRLMNNDQ
ncbi:MAG: hypothetical protein AAFN77_03335 [Planctomycetota bacterium]